MKEGKLKIKAYVFCETNDREETILFASKSRINHEAERECIEWVKQNCTEFKDHWEFDGKYVGITN